MWMTEDRSATRKRNVNGARGPARGDKRRLALDQRGFNGAFQLVRLTANLPLLFWRCTPDEIHERRHPTAFAANPAMAQCEEIGVRAHSVQLFPKESDGSVVTDRRVDVGRHVKPTGERPTVHGESAELP